MRFPSPRLQRIALVLAVAFSAPGPPAQEVTGKGLSGIPEASTIRAPAGGWVDLDTGLVLPEPKAGGAVADLHFDRDGGGFFVRFLRGGMVARPDAVRPEGSWTEDPRRIPRRAPTRTFFGRTDRRYLARVMLTVHDPYSTGSATLRWAVNPPSHAVFLPAPGPFVPSWPQEGLRVDWEGTSPRYLVEITREDGRRRETRRTPHLTIEDPAPDAHVGLRVWGIEEDGSMTLPARRTFRGAPQPVQRGVVRYPDRWYDDTGGLSLTAGKRATAGAEVVFYLYGVYVPGGGVCRVGRGREDFLDSEGFPRGPYPPTYGRLDDGDVYAVVLPDQRHALLWLEPATDDLRRGMRVHYALLSDGRAELLPVPRGFAMERRGAATAITWQPVAGASHYLLEIEGRERPIPIHGIEHLLHRLEANRFHWAHLRVVGVHGGTSEEVAHRFHTFGGGFRLGSFELDATGRRGHSLSRDQALPPDAEGVELLITNSAGGASALGFRAPFGADPGADDFAEPPPEVDPAVTRFRVDEREEGSDVFAIATRDGGCAILRILERDYPVVRIEYVFRKGTGAEDRER